MPSPDVTPYIDLTLLNKDPQDIYENAEAALMTDLPGWVPREGNTEVVLLEALALPVSEAIFAINQLPSAITEVLLRLFGIERDPGAPPVANLEFQMSGTTGYTIPAGTHARLELQNTVSIVFTTDVELVIAPGGSVGEVMATGDAYTSLANGIDAVTLPLMDSILYVNYVTVADPITSGRDPESDADYFTRAMQRLARLSDTLVLPDHFVSATLENPVFQRAVALDNWDGSGGSPGDDPGHITIAVYGPERFNTTDEKNALQATLEADALANLAVHVIDPTITNVDVTVDITILPNYLQADVISAVTEALENYLNPMEWGWGTTVYRNELIALISNVEGVDRVVTLTTPAADQVLTGNAPLALADGIVVSVV